MLSIVAAAAALAAVGCGGGSGSQTRVRPENGQPSRWTRQTMQPQTDPHAPANLIVFRRIRYEGATMRTLYLHPDGTIDVEVPGGGTGASRFDGRVTPATLRDVRTALRRIHWNHLSHHKVELDGSGAYYMLRHAGKEHVAMASGMSPELIPVVKRLNGVLNGDGLASRRQVHRFNIP